MINYYECMTCVWGNECTGECLGYEPINNDWFTADTERCDDHDDYRYYDPDCECDEVDRGAFYPM